MRYNKFQCQFSNLTGHNNPNKRSITLQTYQQNNESHQFSRRASSIKLKNENVLK